MATISHELWVSGDASCLYYDLIPLPGDEYLTTTRFQVDVSDQSNTGGAESV